MSLDRLKNDMKEMLFLSSELGKYEQIYLFHSNIADKANYNEEKSIKIKEKLLSLRERFHFIEEKWF